MPRLSRAIAGVAVVLVSLTGGSLAASAATPTPTPTPTPVAGGVDFTLSPVSDGIVTGGAPLAVSFTVTNDTTLSLPSGHLVLELGNAPITTRDALDTWLSGDTSGVVTREVADATADAVEPESIATTGAVVEGDSPVLRGRAAGVYPLLARYQRPGGELVSTSVMIVPRTGGDVTPVGVVVPITAGPLTAGLLTADQLTALTAPGGALSEQLEAVSGSTAILAVDPAIPASIRVLGDAAPPDATAWLEALLTLPNTRFALQFGDADIASQLASGLSAPLQPTSLQVYMDADDFPAATPSPGPTPEATDAADEPDYPDLAALLDVGGGRANVYWPVGGTADAKTIKALGALGTDAEPGITLIPSASTAAGASTAPAAARVGDAAALLYDSGISAALREASGIEENALRGAPLAAATAMLALATASAGDTPLLVTIDRGDGRSRVALAAAIDAATRLGSTRPAPLGELAAAAPRTTEVTAAEPDAQRVAATSLLREDESDIASFATILDDPAVLTGPQRAEILQVLGAGWLATPDDWQTALTAHREATTTTLDSVGIVPPTPITFATSNASLPFWVRNDLAYPVNVVLYAIPDDLRVDVTRATSVVAGASSNTSVEVPVQASIANGQVSIQLQLRGPTGVVIGGPQSVDVNVHADWERIGVGIILVLVGGLVALGLVRTILRRRRARATTDSETGDGT